MQKAFLEAAKETKKSKESDAVKKATIQSHNTQNIKRNEEMPQTSANFRAPI